MTDKTATPLTAAQLANINRTTHGMSKTRIFRVWLSMLRRCYNPNAKKFKNHGGRGIEVCDQWLHSFRAFYADMGSPPAGSTLERKDNDGPYCRDNCKWATWTEQARNRRSNRLLVVDGASKSVAEWSELHGVKSCTIRRRIDFLGWEVKRAVITPSRTWRS